MKKSQVQNTLQSPQGNKKPMTFFGLFALLVIPLYTFVYARKGHLITSNLSHIGNLPGNRFGFVLWGVVCAIFFFSFFTFVYSLLGCESRHTWNLFRGACVLLVLTVVVPFLPEAYPFFAEMHNHFAHTATILTALATLLLTIQTKKLDKRVFTKALALWLGCMALCAVLVYTTGISGLVEFMFIAAACVQLFFIMHWVARLQPQQQDMAELSQHNEEIYAN